VGEGDAGEESHALLGTYLGIGEGDEANGQKITHHHGDHALGAADFVKAGVKLVVPKVASRLWKESIPEAEIVTFT